MIAAESNAKRVISIFATHQARRHVPGIAEGGRNVSVMVHVAMEKRILAKIVTLEQGTAIPVLARNSARRMFAVMERYSKGRKNAIMAI
jgi:hypothetical protein